MSSSASSTDRTTRTGRFGRIDRAIARVVVAVLVATTPLGAWAGKEFQDANDTTFDPSVVSLDNSRPGQTTFTIDTNRTTIGWQDLHQPNGNTLEFDFADPNSIVLNDIGARHPSELNGTVISNGTVAFANPFGIFIGADAVIDVGSLVAVGAHVSAEDFMGANAMLVPLSGTVENNGLIRAGGSVGLFGRNVVNNGEIEVERGHVLALAGEYLGVTDWDAITADFLAPKNFFGFLGSGSFENNGSIHASDAALFAGRVANQGEIVVDDGTLLMMAADAVWVTEFDNPVLFKVPFASSEAGAGEAAASGPVRYAIENRGRIDAGLGNVRLAAADPLGFAIRQGGRGSKRPASIRARRIELDGGEGGRVHLSGVVDASGTAKGETGGTIDVTGSILVLEDATLDASGTMGGGTIRVGGEQEGRGELQRARAVLVDADSEVRTDALEKGDGGRIILFSEDLTSIDGAVSARGGQRGGDGGFVETSGLRRFAISRTPDLGAPNGRGGSWLIDPFNITIKNTLLDDVTPTPNCPAEGVGCLNKAITAILSPTFDSTGFDGILRTVDPATNVPNANFVSADLIASALATGTDVTLSTQAFGLERGTEDGDIDILDPISIDSSATLEGTTARLTLLAARNINVDREIVVVPTAGRTNLALSVDLRANDASQTESDRTWDTDLLEGDVLLNADIRTGGGDVLLSGSSVVQQAGNTIDTDGGRVQIRSGTVDSIGNALTLIRNPSDPTVDPTTPAPRIEIAGSIDTRDGSDPGGAITLNAHSLNVRTRQAGRDPLSIVTGRLTVTGQLLSGGGDIDLSSGTTPGGIDTLSAGNVDVAMGSIDSAGGDVSITANHVDPNGDTNDTIVSFANPSLDEGGAIAIDGSITTTGGTLSIGNERTRSVELDGNFDTTQIADTTENGLVQIVALDSAAVNSTEPLFGSGSVRIGTTSATTLSTAGLRIESREIVTSDGAGTSVSLTASGSSTATLPIVPAETVLAADGFTNETLNVESGEIDITGNRSVTLERNTALTAETIRITAASRPTELDSVDQPNSETRLTFGGANGAGQTAADGVRLQGDRITLTVGDGTTPSSDLFSEDLGTSAAPTTFALERSTRAAYDGLQLRNATGTNRPEEIGIRQDGDLTITNTAPTVDGELDLGGAFGTATIGAGRTMRTTLESSDGLLRIEDAVALNNDAGESTVVLRGGLLLPDSPSTPSPDPSTVPVPNSVVFGDTQALGQGGTTAFDVESLTVSTPGDFQITQRVVDSIGIPTELVIEAGRGTGVSGAAGRGSLTVDPGLALMADDRLALLAGATGFGDLAFSSGTSLSANDLELRAGGGASSENTSTTSLSRITGLKTNVTIRDALGGIFGDAASTATSFSYRQDARIDAESDLPDLAQFGLMDATGFRISPAPADDVTYRVRSDQGQIDLDDGITGTNEAIRFRNANLSLVGLDSTALPAIDVSSEFAFLGKRIELGGVGNFVFTQALASAFNRSGLVAGEEITLRAGLGGSGNLSFNRGTQSSVIVKAPRINLVVGDGAGLDSQTGSTIDTRNAEFDLTNAAGDPQTFVFHTDSSLDVADLPDASQFLGTGGLPDVLALRTDFGLLDLGNFEISSLPLDLTDDAGRLILEAEAITLSQTDGDDLVLTPTPNLRLRLRANSLTLRATVPDPDPNLLVSNDGVVLAGAQTGDTRPLSGVDGDFDGESLLIEAFDRDALIATTENLSALSADPNMPGAFDLDAGRGPTVMTIEQDGAATAATVPRRDSVSGRFARTISDDDDGNAIATTYSIRSSLSTVRVEPENVNGSTLSLRGIGILAGDGGVFLDPSQATIPIDYDLDSLSVLTESSIVIESGIVINAARSITLNAGVVPILVDDPGTEFGSLIFQTGAATTALRAHEITLTAGPVFKLDRPDADGDGERDEIPDADLPRVDLSGLDELTRLGNLEDSIVSIQQSASLDSTIPGSASDFLGALQAGSGTEKWETLDLAVVQGNLVLDRLDLLKDEVGALIGRTGPDGTIRARVPDQGVTPTPFDDFDDRVRFESNDITFETVDPGTSIDLATDKLEIVSEVFANPGATADQFARLRSDPDVLERPIIRIHQIADFLQTELPRPNQYLVRDDLGELVPRQDLADLDIELRTTGGPGSVLTFDDRLRSRVSFSNLILDSAGDVEIALDGSTPGYDGLDFAALQLASLDVTTGDTDADGIGDGTITIRPFTIATQPAPLTVETTGDQRFDGIVVLESTLSTRGRDIRFTGDVTQSATPDAGLLVSTAGDSIFEGNIGTLANPLDRFVVLFDGGVPKRTPNLQFGRRQDTDGDGIAETALPSDQSVFVRGNILFAAHDFGQGDRTSEIEAGLAGSTTAAEFDTALRILGLGRTSSVPFASVGKANGRLSFNSSTGNFVMAAGEKLAIAGSPPAGAPLPGTSTIDVGTGVAILGDVAAIDLRVVAGEIGLMRRRSGIVLDRLGETQQDAGPSILANSIDFGGVVPTMIGSGRSFRFGLPDPFDFANTPRFLDRFPLFEIDPSGRPLDVNSFRFVQTTGDLAARIPALRPTGASRSDLSGAFGPTRAPTPSRAIPEPRVLQNAERLTELAVNARETPREVILARLEGAAIIDDLDLPWDDDMAAITRARLDAQDADAAIGLYEELFGADGERAAEVREILQSALDAYLANTRARRVVGFELRRFVKNRPSTLLDAYRTLDSLDRLFRYHRRLGLSPGEYRRIQQRWLEQIRPDGITLDELAEAIHPSRYVRGSDILDIFGR